jgi:PhoH-like ATPase
MRKNFVLDTNVLLHDSECLLAFEDNVVNVPIFVLEELDSFKRDQSELGRNARRVARQLDRYRGEGRIDQGVALPNGGQLRVAITERNREEWFSISHAMDNAILSSALSLKAAEPEVPLVFVTKDVNLRIRAEALGIDAQDYDRQKKQLSEVYTGTGEVTVPAAFIDRMYAEGSVPVTELGDALEGAYINQYFTVRSAADADRTVLARYDGEKMVPLGRFRDSVWGVRPRNREQHFALDMLLRDDISMCTLIGKAGTGKTLLALAAGLHGVVNRQSYRKLLVSRPIFPMGRDLGFLPGDLNEKLAPWMQPIHDNVEFLTSVNADRGVETYDDLRRKGVIEVEALTYIRGRSLPQQYMIVDEAQNLTPLEIKTVLTRAGQNTKIVFTGDPAQIDQPYLDSVNNGLTYAAEAFKDQPIAAHVTLVRGERSPLAELAANLL